MQKGVEHGSIAPRRIWTELNGRRIWDKSSAFVMIFVNRVIYPIFTDGPNRINSSPFHKFEIGTIVSISYLFTGKFPSARNI